MTGLIKLLEATKSEFIWFKLSLINLIALWLHLIK